MSMWNPWRGCHKCSDGCKYCYIHKGDAKRGVDTNIITLTPQFHAPIDTIKSGAYKIKPGQMVYTCFSSDFLLEDADPWREECWQMIRTRHDLHFLFLTKRIHRFMQCIPPDWADGYDNVTVGCTVENQSTVDDKLSLFAQLPIKHKNIICQPLIEQVNILPYLDNIELTVVGGESDPNARPFHFEWALAIRDQCLAKGVPFQFRQCGTHFFKEGTEYVLPVNQLCKQAKKANINC